MRLNEATKIFPMAMGKIILIMMRIPPAMEPVVKVVSVLIVRRRSERHEKNGNTVVSMVFNDVTDSSMLPRTAQRTPMAQAITARVLKHHPLRRRPVEVSVIALSILSAHLSLSLSLCHRRRKSKCSSQTKLSTIRSGPMVETSPTRFGEFLQ